MGKSKQTILVVAAHPDDEILGCGATMARHASSGDAVHVLILAEGITSRDGQRDRKAKTGELDSLSKSAKKANDAVGVSSLTLHDFPDNRMDSVDLIDVVKVIEAKIAQLKPVTVYTHSAGDLNVDHRVTHQAVLTACRPVPGQSVKSVLTFEVASSTEWAGTGQKSFAPNFFVDVSGFLDRKLKALECYASEMRPFPHARSIRALEHLAGLRGSQIGVEAAEAFFIERMVS